MAHQAISSLTMTAGTWIEDFSPLVLEPPLPGGDVTLWGAISKEADGEDPKEYQWMIENQTQITVTSGEDMDTTETEMTFASGELAAAGVRAGAMLVNATDRTKVEVILVSSVDSATSCTVVRDQGGFVSGSGGGTTGETHTSGDVFEIIGYLNWEGSSVTKTDYFAKRDRSHDQNYYSLLDDWTQISASDMAREYRGSSPDNWGYQVKGLVTRLERQFERHLLYSPQVARAAGQRGSMGGLMWYARLAAAATAGSYITTAEDFSYEVWDDSVKYIWKKNGDKPMDLVTIMGVDEAQTIPYIHESAMRMEYGNENVRGMYANTLQSTVRNQRVPIIISETFPANAFMTVNLKAFRIHFLKGRALRIYNKAVGEGLDDYQASRYLSEMTLEAQRTTENCYFHTGLTFNR